MQYEKYGRQKSVEVPFNFSQTIPNIQATFQKNHEKYSKMDFKNPRKLKIPLKREKKGKE